MTADVQIILLAAGRSSRMEGRDKTLEKIAGAPLLRHLALECLASGATQTHVVLPPDRPERADAVRDLDLNSVVARDAHLGMSASLKAGVAAAKTSDAVLIMLADMPEITRDHIDVLIAAFDPEGRESIVRAASADGKPGHPVLLAQKHFDELEALTGDQGARVILERHKSQMRLVALNGKAATTDLDTPQAWAKWRALQQQNSG